MISRAPRFFNFRRTASSTIERKSPVYSRGTALKSTVFPVRSRPRCCSPIHLPAASWASSQLKRGAFYASNVALFSCAGGGKLP